MKIIYNPDIHKRHSIRLKKYDYAKEGMYFVTICIKNRECLLGEIVNQQMKLNQIGNIVEQEVQRIKCIFQYCNIKIYQIMPNHIHFILCIEKENKIALGNVIRYFKGRISSKTKIYWQRNYYEHIIRNQNEYNAIYKYILDNPLNWEENNKYE